MTASYNKGKKKYYMYYQCTAERGKVIRGEFIHDRVEEVLAHLSFTEEQVTKITAFAKEELRKATNYRTESIKGRERDLKEMQGKIKKLEEKMLNDLIEPATYRSHPAADQFEELIHCMHTGRATTFITAGVRS